MKNWTRALIILLLLGHIGWAVLHFTGRSGPGSRDIQAAARLIGLEFTAAERKMMIEGVRRNLENYQQLRDIPLPNPVPPALVFQPWTVVAPLTAPQALQTSVPLPARPGLELPEDPRDIAFLPISDLARLIRSGRLTSLQLTEIYLARLKKYGPQLECVITLTEDLARKQARRADEEIASGRWRGPLHGIPYGAKDLLAVPGAPTTWGAAPFREQSLKETATVVARLREAGAVLAAKLTLGALAMGDVWFGGRTRNPWNPEQGSRGSSAGSAAATAAGLVGFAIGTETLGSIISPATRCGVSGLRPTFGRVSRFGAMALSWSMDKIGPLCRSAEDCALVLNAICGSDGKDTSVIDRPFAWDPALDILSLRIGYLEPAFQQESRSRDNDLAVLDALRGLGVELIPIRLPDIPAGALRIILISEAAAAFDELTRSGRDDLMVRQNRGAWPNSFRQARLIPAVEYIQANRVRTLLMRQMAELMRTVDVYVSPSYGGNTLLYTNLTGHPVAVVPDGFDEKGAPTSISFTGRLFREAEVLAVANAYQKATGFHLMFPDLETNLEAMRRKKLDK